MREALRWARMSLDGDLGLTLDQAGAEAAVPGVPTRRGPGEEETVTGRASDLDDETAKRFPARPLIRRRSQSDGVYTSAPPVTQRDVPPSMIASEDPTFSLRHAPPPFALRLGSSPDTVPETAR